MGYWALVLTFAVSAYACALSILGGRRGAPALLASARNGMLVTAATSTLAVGLLLALLLRHDLSVAYVHGHTSADLPTPYTIAALWAGQEGSLLVWLWFLALMSAAVALLQRTKPDTYGPYVAAAMAGVQAFLALVLLLASNPFELLPVVPSVGRGLNPLLLNIWMVMHPPVVFLGYAAYTVPFALTLAGLVTGAFSEDWLEAMRRWALWAWLFLGAGILMGAWWAYLELSWGGYWSWDPVENSSLVPWLTGTALLHSLMMQQRRGAFKVWNLGLAAVTFVLCLFATFVTRSGLIQSVHAFGQSSLGYYFVAAMVVSLVATAYLLHRRRTVLAEPRPLGRLLSREGSLLLTNLLFVGAAAVLLLGILFPTVAEVFLGRQGSLGASYYERAFVPLGQAIVLLIGVCPWLAWGGTTRERLWSRLAPGLAAAAMCVALVLLLGAGNGPAVPAFAVAAFVLASVIAVLCRDVAARRRTRGEGIVRTLFALAGRNRRRYGGHLVHLGVVLIAVGITGSSLYQREVQVSLAPGEEVEFAGYGLRYRQADAQEHPLYYRIVAEVDVRRGGSQIATVRPTKDLHWSTDQWKTGVAVRSTPREDLYVVLTGMEQDGLASFRLVVNPLVMWLWVGGAALLMGGVLAWWPSASRGREVAEREGVGGEAGYSSRRRNRAAEPWGEPVRADSQRAQDAQMRGTP